MKLDIELLIKRLLKFYNIKTLTDLAIKLDTTQSTISGWKSRNAIGTLVDILVIKEPELLSDLFKISDDNNTYISSIKENENISINNTLLEKTRTKAEKYGLNTNSYVEYLIIQDLEKNMQ